ncbi:flagellar hook-basal body protein FliE [Planctomycetes bacterium Pla163]|uniref:Flagellar hook-basal body complex protein FliE n=1 Tax=Rohdeia mirabilis TaxID=2528008 RepID=A0A518D4U4_9BACT|nr:flagellar hook-basal body protein FliE [Planctomycetes bacterium Pla163]
MTGIDSKSAFDQAWRAAIERRSQTVDQGGIDLRDAFEQQAALFEDQFSSAASASLSSGGTDSASRGGSVPSAGSATSVSALGANHSIGATEGGSAVRVIDKELKSADSITADLLAGRIDSPHEVAARVRRADLTLKFSLEIRNRLIDAYREVMRMSV